MKILALSLLLSVSVSALANECAVDSAQLAAHYQVKENDSAYTMTLWRNGNSIAQEFENTHIVNMWHLLPNQQLRLVRYFDAQQRAIEYEPNDIRYRSQGDHWQYMSQLVSDAMLSEMQKQSTTGEGCERVETYHSVKGDETIELEWLPELKLVKTMTIHGHEGETHWQMEKLIKDQKLVKQQFLSRDRYESTDYADIGDNESDPFLLKMIKLGYIQHGGSGFYDQHGNEIGDAHHH